MKNRYTLEELIQGEQTETNPIDNFVTENLSPLNNFLKGIHRRTSKDEELAEKHIKMANIVSKLTGREVKELLLLQDYELQSLYNKARTMELGEFRKQIDLICDKAIESNNGYLGVKYLQNLTSEFGKLVLSMEPYSFELYQKGEDLIYRKIGKPGEELVGEYNSMNIVKLVKLFRDELRAEKLDD